MTTITGIRIAADVDDTVTAVQFDASDILNALNESIGCDLIESIEYPGGVSVLFNEEGKQTGAQPNFTATAVVGDAGIMCEPGLFIAGNVVFLGNNDAGEFVSLTEAQRESILRAIVIVRS